VIFALAAFAHRCYRGSAVMTREIGTAYGDLDRFAATQLNSRYVHPY